MNEDIIRGYEAAAAESSDMVEHMPVIRDLAVDCRSIVEFGVYDCTSTWALAAGMPKKLTSYDIIRRPEVDAVEKAAAGSYVEFKFVLASSTEVEIEGVDMLFIDSLHTYEHLKKELEMHAEKVAFYIVMHDTTTFGTNDETWDGTKYVGRGLWPAIEEFLSAHPEWSVKERRTNCHGLTVLSRTYRH